jgi:hypothetical protein
MAPVQMAVSSGDGWLQAVAGIRSTTHCEAQIVPADDSHERRFMGELHNYYDEVILVIRNAESILISAFVNCDSSAADFFGLLLSPTGKRKKQRSFRLMNP